MTNGYYYLHTNGELIYKPAIVVESDPQYFDSDFVRKVWKINPEDRGSGYVMLIEAAAMGARMNRVMELAALWQMHGDDGLEFCKRAELEIEKVETEAGPGYTVWKDSRAQTGEGSTPLLALISYCKQGPLGRMEKNP